MSEQNAEFSCLRDAFCDRYRCKPDAFIRKAFWKSMPAAAKIPAMLLGGLSNERFGHDVEIIAGLAEATSPEDLNHAIDDLVGIQVLDHSSLRRWFGIRVSPGLLRNLMAPLLAKVRRRVETIPQTPAPRPAQSNQVVIPVPTHRSAESATQRLRQAMRIHASIIVGTPLDQVLASELITRRELEEFLSEFSNLRPEITWLRTYVREQEELARLREEAGPNDRFKAL